MARVRRPRRSIAGAESTVSSVRCWIVRYQARQALPDGCSAVVPAGYSAQSRPAIRGIAIRFRSAHPRVVRSCALVPRARVRRGEAARLAARGAGGSPWTRGNGFRRSLVDDRFRTAGLIGKDLLHRLEDALASQLREADLAGWRIEHAGEEDFFSFRVSHTRSSILSLSAGEPREPDGPVRDGAPADALLQARRVPRRLKIDHRRGCLKIQPTPPASVERNALQSASRRKFSMSAPRFREGTPPCRETNRSPAS